MGTDDGTANKKGVTVHGLLWFAGMSHDCFQTIETLEELKQMFLSIAAMIGGDIHFISPHAQASVKEAERKLGERPSSVNSQSLADPDLYRKTRPKANRNVLDDDMLYAYVK